MSCKRRREIILFLFAITLCYYTFQMCYSVSLGQREDIFTAYQVQESTPSRSWESIKQDNQVQQGNLRLVEQVIKGANMRTSNQQRPPKVQRESAAFPGKAVSYSSVPKLDKTGINFALNRLSWAAGNISMGTASSASDSVDGYQADFTGFPGVQGEVLGPSFDSSQHFSEWLAMKPAVYCDDNAMTFTASGPGFKHLLVDREGASPVSLFQLPLSCGYSMRTSWSALKMMAPYDACYIKQENGSYVLPMLWWGSPVKLSCPVQSTSVLSSSISAPSVFCSSCVMAVQIYGNEKAIKLLRVRVNGSWGPFVSENCAYRDESQLEVLTFFIPYRAPCITMKDDLHLHLHLILDNREYILSCPADPQFPYVPSPSSPDIPGFPYVPDPDIPAPATPPQLPTQEHIALLPQYPYYPYPGIQYPHLPQVYPPGPQPAHPHQPSYGRPPGPQPHEQQQFLYPMRPGKFSPGDPQKYPSPPYQHPVLAKVPLRSFPYPSGLYYPDVPFIYPPIHAATKTTTTVPPATQPPIPPGSPYYHVPTAAPVVKTPSPPPPPVPPKQPMGGQYQVSPFYPPTSYSYYYPYGAFFYPESGLEVQPLPAPPPATTTTTRSPGYPSGQFYPQRPIYFLVPAPPSHQTIAQKPAAPEATCPPHTNTICSHYPFLCPPYYYPSYPFVPQYPETTTTTPTTTPTPTRPTSQMPHLQCRKGWMVVFLPFAQPDSVQVIDEMKTWLFLSSVSPLCGYIIQMAGGSGVILHSPLPACHSQSRTPTTISLPLRFWDLSTAQYRTVEPQCPYESTPETPALLKQRVSPSPPSTTKDKISPSVLSAPKVSCSFHQMSMEFPSGPISGIAVKDIKGNQMNLQDVPEHCGYSASEGKDGKIRLSLQLHSRCHMSVQDKMYIITVVYMTVNGIREGQFSCPVVIPRARKECNLPSEQHLPCGPESVSQPQCRSMGCCFSKHPPACYYPMDECTIDRHFVFSVPASLMDPPLSPSMLVTAGNSTCNPQRVTSDFALFKIPMDDCGTRRVTIGQTVVYMVEVINKVHTVSLNYGTITRDSPVRLLVECRFLHGTVLSVGYLVKTPTLEPGVQTQGVFGVQLRIARDAQYSSYYPQYHQPLQMLLGKPLYLEVRLLNSPDPSLVLLVHFCVAYPRSATAVWVLLYNGCPNPLDPAPQQAVLSDPQTSSPRGQTRRFTISTFQFLPDGEFMDPDEEIYFMCSTEICSPRDGPCVEGCFGQ